MINVTVKPPQLMSIKLKPTLHYIFFKLPKEASLLIGLQESKPARRPELIFMVIKRSKDFNSIVFTFNLPFRSLISENSDQTAASLSA